MAEQSFKCEFGCLWSMSHGKYTWQLSGNITGVVVSMLVRRLNYGWFGQNGKMIRAMQLSLFILDRTLWVKLNGWNEYTISSFHDIVKQSTISQNGSGANATYLLHLLFSLEANTSIVGSMLKCKHNAWYHFCGRTPLSPVRQNSWSDICCLPFSGDMANGQFHI